MGEQRVAASEAVGAYTALAVFCMASLEPAGVVMDARRSCTMWKSWLMYLREQHGRLSGHAFPGPQVVPSARATVEKIESAAAAESRSRAISITFIFLLLKLSRRSSGFERPFDAVVEPPYAGTGRRQGEEMETKGYARHSKVNACVATKD